MISVRARPRFRAEDVRKEVLSAVYRLFDPLRGRPGGHRVAARPVGAGARGERRAGPHPGVDMAEEVSVQLFPADPATGRRGSAVQRLPLAPTALVFSYEHQVRVRQ